MNRKKICLALFFMVFCAFSTFADNLRVSVEITGVEVNGGNIYVEVYTNERDHKKDVPFASFILESANITLIYELELPEGECLVWGY